MLSSPRKSRKRIGQSTIPRAEVELVAAACRGDEQAFSALIQEHESILRAYCKSFCWDSPIRSDELWVESLEKIRCGLPGFGARSQFTTWAYRVIRNHFLNKIRALPKIEAPVGIDKTILGDGSPRHWEAQATKQWLRQAVCLLPLRARALIALHHLLGLPYDQIARVFGLPPGTVASQLHDHRNALGKILKETADLDRPGASSPDPMPIHLCAEGSELMTEYLLTSGLGSDHGAALTLHLRLCAICSSTNKATGSLDPRTSRFARRRDSQEFGPARTDFLESLTDSPAELVRTMIGLGRLKIRNGPLLDKEPGRGNRPWARVEGMLIGLAQGETLGGQKDGEATKLAEVTLRSLIEQGRLEPGALNALMRSAPVSLPSPSLEASRSCRGEWDDCGIPSPGCGALRRVAPIIIPHLRTRTRDLWADAALATMITHNDSASLASSLAFVALLWELLACEPSSPHPSYSKKFLRNLLKLEMTKDYPALAKRYQGWRGSLAGYLRRVLADARQLSWSFEDACREWGSGSYVLEMIPSLLYLLELHGHDPELAIRLATTIPGDRASLGALAGAAIGALHGPQPDWPVPERLSLLLGQAKRIFDT